jgi:plasmid stability protein
MARRRKWARERAQLKIRLPEQLRLSLERAARGAGRSLNAEVVARLGQSIMGHQDPDALAAAAIMNGLDQRILKIIEERILEAYAEKGEDLASFYANEEGDKS